MAVPSYNASGTGSNTSSSAVTPAWPSPTVAKAIAIMHAGVRGSSLRTLTTPAGWGLVNTITAFTSVLNSRNYVFVYGTTTTPTALTSTETGTVTVTASTAGSTVGRIGAIIHQFTGDSSVWHFENIGDQNSTTAPSTTFSDKDVIASSNSRLAINLANSNTALGSLFVVPTNMTGGTWVSRNNTTSTSVNPSFHLITADMASSGTVGSGTSTQVLATYFGIAGFSIYTDAAASGNIGGAFTSDIFTVSVYRPVTVR